VKDLSFLSDIPDPAEMPSNQPSDMQGEPLPAWLDRLPAAPTRADTTRKRRVALLLSASWVVLHVVVYGLRKDLHRLPIEYILVHVGWPLVLSLALLGVVFARGKTGLGLPTWIFATLAVLGPLSFALATLGVRAPVGLKEDLSRASVGICFDITFVCAVLPLLAVAWSLRSAFATHSTLRAVLLGAAAGAFSGAMLNLHCENVDPVHMLLGHAGPTFVLAAIAAVVLSRILRLG
jgi:hypothetical protein